MIAENGPSGSVIFHSHVYGGFSSALSKLFFLMSKMVFEKIRQLSAFIDRPT
jgi:hypothetical protein